MLRDTPQEAYRKEGANGEDFRLVFSDEFNTEGRSFWPGDDPYWEGVELHCAACVFPLVLTGISHIGYQHW